MVIWGVVYYCFNHITSVVKTCKHTYFTASSRDGAVGFHLNLVWGCHPSNMACRLASPSNSDFPSKKTTPSTSKCETMKPSSYWEPPWTWTVGFPGSPALGPRADGDASKVAGWMVACDSPNIPKVWGFHIGNLTHHQNLLIQGRVLDQEWRTLDSSNENGGIMGKHVGKHQMISTKGRLQVV